MTSIIKFHFFSLRFVQPFHYSNHNAVARKGPTNALISFDSCTLPPHRLWFSTPLLCLWELGFFGDPHKRFLKSEGLDCHRATHRLQLTDTVGCRNTRPMRSFTDIGTSQPLNRSNALHWMNSITQKENGGNKLFLIWYKEAKYSFQNVPFRDAKC